jgi:hypothetical protein
MTKFTVEIVEIPNGGGYIFIRSDGQHFFLIPVGDKGNAELYAGVDPNKPGAFIVTLQNFTDNVARALDHVLVYPNQLNDQHIRASFTP